MGTPFGLYFFFASAEDLPDQNNIRFHLKNEDSTLVNGTIRPFTLFLAWLRT
jgi:hypothetical protein